MIPQSTVIIKSGLYKDFTLSIVSQVNPYPSTNLLGKNTLTLIFLLSKIFVAIVIRLF